MKLARFGLLMLLIATVAHGQAQRHELALADIERDVLQSQHLLARWRQVMVRDAGNGNVRPPTFRRLRLHVHGGAAP